jgi:hypothetical protein
LDYVKPGAERAGLVSQSKKPAVLPRASTQDQHPQKPLNLKAAQSHTESNRWENDRQIHFRLWLCILTSVFSVCPGESPWLNFRIEFQLCSHFWRCRGFPVHEGAIAIKIRKGKNSSKTRIIRTP